MDNEWNIDQSFHFMEHQRHFLDSADSQRTGLWAHKPPKKHGLGVRHLWPTPKATLRRSHLLRSWQSKTRQEAASSSRFDCQRKIQREKKCEKINTSPTFLMVRQVHKSDSGKALRVVDALACPALERPGKWMVSRSTPGKVSSKKEHLSFTKVHQFTCSLGDWTPKPFLSVPTHAHSLAHSKCRCYRPKLLPLSGIQRHFESAAVATWTWKPWRVPQTSTDGGFFHRSPLRWRQTIHVARGMFQHLQTFSTSQRFTATRSI